MRPKGVRSAERGDHLGAEFLLGEAALGSLIPFPVTHAVGVDGTGADGVDGDAVWGQVHGRGLGQADNGELAGRVGGAVRAGLLAGVAGDVDHAASVAQADHLPARELGTQEHGGVC